MIAANPIELAVGNMVRRVLHIIREEDVSLTSSAIPGVSVESDDDESDSKSSYSAAAIAAANRSALRAPSLHNLLESIPDPVKTPEAPAASVGDSDSKSRSGDRNSVSWKLKHNVIEGITELLQDLDDYHTHVAEQALEHIHQNEVILTLGRSRSLLKFLLEAKKKRSFQVVVAEGAPRYQGHTLAKELAEKGLQTTVITDSAVFAMISRVNMVIIGAHAVMANGGVLAPVGMHMVALAARRHAVPFVVLAGVHKLCPQYPHKPYTLLNDMKSPAEVVEFGELSECFAAGTGDHTTYVVNPTFDYIPPDLVSIFITDTGGHNPSYVYRLIAEYYSPEDYFLQ
nr:translation initiation factor eIF-2B subunit beta-like isoform X3 [Physcomitrium patens]XP_024358674.1 translation initiation factor eIF-2B subunit beta-like isoform X3 [Physcomitrium patens]|eukprot:XP_024358673.1 translation initiation factor eIF-2B subunit beta-like isoform X3 [Physcomitrella patens]